MLSRLARAWRATPKEGRMAAGAAVLLFLTMFLPWYQLTAVVNERDGGRLVGDNMNAFGVFSFVEAAVLLVAIAVLFLLFARAEGRSFHLPGGDGTIVMIAGGWTALLLVWRLFDKPNVNGSGVGSVGIQWGIFFALGAAGLLTYAGARMRAAHRPEPEGPREVGPDERAARRRRPPPGTEETRPLPAEPRLPEPPQRAEPRTEETGPRPADPPEWEDEPRPADPPRRRRPQLSTDRLPDEDQPTRRLPEDEAPTRRLPDDPPAERRAERDRPSPQTERLWDDR